MVETEVGGLSQSDSLGDPGPIQVGTKTSGDQYSHSENFKMILQNQLNQEPNDCVRISSRKFKVGMHNRRQLRGPLYHM